MHGIGYHEVHGLTSDGSQLLFQLEEIGVDKSARLDRLEVHQQIQVAATRIEVIAQGRAEQVHALHLVLLTGSGDGVELGLGEGKTHGFHSAQASRVAATSISRRSSMLGALGDGLKPMWI